MFLGKAFIMAILIIVLVKVIAESEVCYFESDLGQLPDSVQRILLDENGLDSLRCPYGRLTKKVCKLDVIS